MAHPLFGEPGTAFEVPAPILSSDPPKTRDLNLGQGVVAKKTGAFTYAYPISVAPGRGGATPKLNLTYSSQGSIYGGIAAGWQLPIPSIHVDHKQSELEVSVGFYPRIYRSSLSGDSRLVPFTDDAASDVAETYRARYDDAFIRYERLQDSVGGPGQRWRARMTSGSVYWFGERDHFASAPTSSDLGYSPFGASLLTRVVDAHGNTVHYDYEPVYVDGALGDYRLAKIRYSTNEGESVGEHARVEFVYTQPSCGARPIGADTRYVAGVVHHKGASRLQRIETRVLENSDWRIVRRVQLGYDDTLASRCDAKHAPVRLLESIQETAWAPSGTPGSPGAAKTLPPVTFSYGRVEMPNLTPDSGFDLTTIDSQYDDALSWGYDPTHFTGPNSPPWPELHSTTMDLDGDGLLDRLMVMNAPTCTIGWQRNLGDRFASVQQVNLPTVPAFAGASIKRCTLSGQWANVENQTQVGSCTGTKGAQLAYRFIDVSGDGKPELITSLYYDAIYYDPDDETGSLGYTAPPCPGDPDKDKCVVPDPGCLTKLCDDSTTCKLNPDIIERCSCEGQLVECKALSIDGDLEASPSCDTPLVPHSVCGSGSKLYVWNVYENLGGGTFESSPQTLLSPVKLQGMSGNPPIAGSAHRGWSSTGHAFTDIDGDGYPDAVFDSDDGENDIGYWHVLRGHWNDSTGEFVLEGPSYTCDIGGGATEVREVSYLWTTPENAPISKSQNGALTGIPDQRYIAGRSQLADMNGDGLPDLIWKNPGNFDVSREPDQGTSWSTNRLVFYNTGSGFRIGATNNGTEGTPRLAPASGDLIMASYARATNLDTWPGTSGTHTQHLRAVDFDADGIPEYFDAWQASNLHVNAGMLPLLPPVQLVSSELIAALQPLTTMDQGEWKVERQLIDLDGDGVAELVDTGASPAERKTRVDPEEPPRLMIGIDNGRGAKTEIAYTAYSNASTDYVVKSDQNPLPKNVWVVKRVERNRGDGGVANIDYSYKYKNAFYNQVDGDWGFRGFGLVNRHRGDGGGRMLVSRQQYSYTLDPRGRPYETTTYDDNGKQLTFKRRVWQKKQLGGATDSFHVTRIKNWVCVEGTSNCKANPPTSVDERTITKVAAEGAGTAEIWAATQRVRQAPGGPVDGDTWVDTDYKLFSDAGMYRFRTFRVERFEQQAGSPVEIGQKENDWGLDGLDLLASTVYSPDPEQPGQLEALTTEYTYDALGNRLTVRKPKQVEAGSATQAITAYDANKLFPATVTLDVDQSVDPDSVDQVTELETDLGTGVTLVTRGPNEDSGDKEETSVEIDGFGRIVKTYESVDAPGGGYDQELVSENIFDDDNNLATARQRIDYGGADWVETVVEIDGFGRVVAETVKNPGGTDAVSTYVYDDYGRLESATMPHPGQNGAQVVYSYQWDLADRLLSVTMPTQTGADRVEFDYGGWDLTELHETVTRSEVRVGGAGNRELGIKITATDRYGRLSSVRELAQTPGVFAETTYQYDGNDNVAVIVDPEGVVTEIEHDWLGRRTAITRQGRTWSYGYDFNGNMTFEISPVPAGAPVLSYTTSTVYDELDRSREWSETASTGARCRKSSASATPSTSMTPAP